MQNEKIIKDTCSLRYIEVITQFNKLVDFFRDNELEFGIEVDNYFKVIMNYLDTKISELVGLIDFPLTYHKRTNDILLELEKIRAVLIHYLNKI